MPDVNEIERPKQLNIIRCGICVWYGYITPASYFVYTIQNREIATCGNHLSYYRTYMKRARPITTDDINRYNTPPSLNIRSTD